MLNIILVFKYIIFVFEYQSSHGAKQNIRKSVKYITTPFIPVQSPTQDSDASTCLNSAKKQVLLNGTVFLPASQHSSLCHLSRDNLKHFYLPNPSHQFNFSPCNLCTVSSKLSYLAHATLICTFYYYYYFSDAIDDKQLWTLFIHNDCSRISEQFPDVFKSHSTKTDRI